MKISDLYLKIRAIPKTIYFNFKYFKFSEAIKLPVLVSHNVYLKKTKGKVTIDNPSRFGVKIGFGDVGVFDKHRSRTIWENSGHVVFKAKAKIGHGSKIVVAGLLDIGDNFTITAESSIICFNYIKIGDEVLMSWENLIMDTDFHKIRNENNAIINPDKEVIIGDHVWVGSRCTILKGAVIKKGNVIAANSVITSKNDFQNSIIGGHPTKIIKENISWSVH